VKRNENKQEMNMDCIKDIQIEVRSIKEDLSRHKKMLIDQMMESETFMEGKVLGMKEMIVDKLDSNSNDIIETIQNEFGNVKNMIEDNKRDMIEGNIELKNMILND
jgi:hypothetical protein